MTRLERRYTNTFASLGRPLGPRDRTPAREIAAAERSLGRRIPEALRVFYRLAGRATDFTSVHDRFLPPKDWAIESNKLVFLEENQVVVVYGIEAGEDPAADPPIFMAANVERHDLIWYKVCESCSEFIDVMVHWEGAFGSAMATGGAAIVSPRLKATLDRDWMSIGEVNKMWAYRKRGRAVCYVRWGKDGWRIFVGATSEANVKAVARDLGVKWEHC